MSASPGRLESQRDQLAADQRRDEEQAAAAVKVGRDDLARLALERNAARLLEQAETAGEKVQQALPDEMKTREYLEVKHDALSRIQWG